MYVFLCLTRKPEKKAISGPIFSCRSSREAAEDLPDLPPPAFHRPPRCHERRRPHSGVLQEKVGSGCRTRGEKDHQSCSTGTANPDGNKSSVAGVLAQRCAERYLYEQITPQINLWVRVSRLYNAHAVHKMKPWLLNKNYNALITQESGHVSMAQPKYLTYCLVWELYVLRNKIDCSAAHCK